MLTFRSRVSSNSQSSSLSNSMTTDQKSVTACPDASLSFCSVCSQSEPSRGRLRYHPRDEAFFMCILICGCSWKARSLAGLLPPLATSHCCRSCPGTPVSAAADWLRCSVHWRNGHRRSRERSKSLKK